MKTRMLRDIEVSEVGMGCMALSHGYGKIPPVVKPSGMPMPTAAPFLTRLKCTVRISRESATTS